ncbi:MAG: hypothetical protein PHX78_03170 [bacterium]|nr:hypothetical protein [bacterium]
MRKNQKQQFPLIAELNDLTNCLNQMGTKPLKLIANKVYREVKETKWDVPMWSFISNKGIIKDKKLLTNPEDTFQFSLANQHSKQDFHVHKKIFEIYVSYSKIEILYINKEKTKESLKIFRGILIVPPMLIHKIKLHGITFVFQVGAKGSKVHNDKKILKSSAYR